MNYTKAVTGWGRSAFCTRLQLLVLRWNLTSNQTPPCTWHLASEPELRPYRLVWVSKPTMPQPTKKERRPPKLEGNEEPPTSASAEALASLSTQAQAEQTPATLTPRPGGRCGFFCHPWCLLLALTLLLLSLLGSWAVVHLSLETRGGSPFRVSASYNQRVPQDDTATIEPHFTTNCTMGKLEHSLFHPEVRTSECMYVSFVRTREVLK